MLFHRKVPLYVSAPLLAITVMTVGAARWPDETPRCVSAVAWVQDHRADLPASLAGFGMYTGIYRRAMYNALPIDAQRRLWEEQIRAFLTPAANRTSVERTIVARSGISELSAVQADLLRGELGRFDIYFDPSRSIAERQAAINARFEVLQAAFDKDLLYDVFETLGADTAMPAASASLADVALNASALSVRKVSLANCNCNLVTDLCCAPGTGCFTQPTGCGPLMTDECDGTIFQCATGKKVVRPRRPNTLPKA